MRILALLITVFCANLAHAQRPSDPFAGDYRLPETRELGSTAGQFRIMGSGTLGLGGKQPEVGLLGTLELMTFAYLGVRGTLQVPVHRDAHEPFVAAAKVGPSLHLLPYHRVDLSMFCEGGVALVAPRTKHSTATPVLAPGGTLEIWLKTWLFVRTEGHLDWAVYEAAPGAQRYLRFVGALGLGLAL